MWLKLEFFSTPLAVPHTAIVVTHNTACLWKYLHNSAGPSYSRPNSLVNALSPDNTLSLYLHTLIIVVWFFFCSAGRLTPSSSCPHPNGATCPGQDRTERRITEMAEQRRPRFVCQNFPGPDVSGFQLSVSVVYIGHFTKHCMQRSFQTSLHFLCKCLTKHRLFSVTS